MSNKIFVALAVMATGAAGAAWYLSQQPSKTLPFESVCDQENKRFTDLCKEHGMRAGSLPDMSALVDKDYGEILGVAWRNKGDLISRPGESPRRSETNDYYYIICPDEEALDTCFLRLHSEVQPREPSAEGNQSPAPEEKESPHDDQAKD